MSHGSALGPLLFILYVGDLERIVDLSGLTFHTNANDGQLCSSCLPSERDALRIRVQDCIKEIIKWTATNRLALNPDKTEILWVSYPRRNHLIDRKPFVIGAVKVVPSK